MSAPQAGGSASDAMAAALAAFVAREEGLAPERVRAANLRRLAGGASREIWSVDLAIERDGRVDALPLVVRKDPAGRVGDGGDRGVERGVLRAAFAGGVPVPRPRWGTSDASVLGAPFFLMDRVEGETLPQRLLREERYAATRAGMAAELGAILAKIHALDLASPDLAGVARPPAGVAPARAELAKTAQAIRDLAVEPHPVLELAERWLAQRAPEPPRIALVHGDYRVGNAIFDERGVRAILDWELVHVGDPIEDLGWLCTRAWRFGSPLPAGGVGTREQLALAYEQASGTKVDREALRFWEAFGSFKVALVFVMQSRVYLDGRVRSIELASLGRRTVEAEDALLRFLRGEE
ncbi:MAG: phosphotransferase family protein [Proteobacteria bacterium]|nr:MAG: phosphotransferase family protein [Pseudomonadota bacterium]